MPQENQLSEDVSVLLSLNPELNLPSLLGDDIKPITTHINPIQNNEAAITFMPFDVFILTIAFFYKYTIDHPAFSIFYIIIRNRQTFLHS